MKKILLSMALLAAVCSGQAQNGRRVLCEASGFSTGCYTSRESGYGGKIGTDATTVGLATDGTDCFPAFRYQYLYRS